MNAKHAALIAEAKRLAEDMGRRAYVAARLKDLAELGYVATVKAGAK